MKSCPTCKRTYSDETLTFCLVDGSILSAPYNSHQTLQIPAARATEPATEILKTIPSPSDSPLLSTIQSPHAPASFPERPRQQPRDKRSAIPWIVIGIVIGLAGVVVLAAVVGLIALRPDEATDTRPNSNVGNINALPSPTPSATVAKGTWGPRNDNAGINEGERITYYPGTTPEKCQADCDATARCIAYTYIRAGAYNPNDPPMCYLMSEAKEFSPSPCCISAMKN